MTRSERTPSAPIKLSPEDLNKAAMALEVAATDFKERSQKGMSPCTFHSEARVLVCASVVLNKKLNRLAVPANRNLSSILEHRQTEEYHG